MVQRAEGKDVYIYNGDAEQFLLIMTDPLDDRVQGSDQPDRYTCKRKINFLLII